MRTGKILTTAVVLLFGLFFFALEARAQTVTGYTSIDYYDAANVVDAYSETDEDYDVDSVYGAFVKLSVVDQNWNQIALESASDDGTYGFAAVEIQFYGSPDTTYTAVGVHKAYAMEWDYNYENWPLVSIDYYDHYDFSFFENQDIFAPLSYSFLGPGFMVTRPTQPILLGATVDEDSVATGLNEIFLNDVTVYERGATFSGFRIANLSMNGSSHYSDTCGSGPSSPFEVRVHFELPGGGTLAHERCAADGYDDNPEWIISNVTCTIEKGHTGRLVFNAYRAIQNDNNPKITLVVGGDSPGGRIDTSGAINLTCSQ
jgi:hypothetical protein